MLQRRNMGEADFQRSDLDYVSAKRAPYMAARLHLGGSEGLLQVEMAETCLRLRSAQIGYVSW